MTIFLGPCLLVDDVPAHISRQCRNMESIWLEIAREGAFFNSSYATGSVLGQPNTAVVADQSSGRKRFASQAIALANRSHAPNWREIANSMRIPTKTGTMNGLFSLSVHPVRRGARAGDLGEYRTTPEPWRYMIGM